MGSPYPFYMGCRNLPRQAGDPIGPPSAGGDTRDFDLLSAALYMGVHLWAVGMDSAVVLWGKRRSQVGRCAFDESNAYTAHIALCRVNLQIDPGTPTPPVVLGQSPRHVPAGPGPAGGV